MKLAAMGALVLPALLAAQAPQAAPQPSAEVKKLEVFAGKWAGTGEMKPGPMGPGGKMTSSSTCEWFAGHFHLVCRSTGTTPQGPMQGLGILGYNSERKQYTYYGIDNSPMPAEPAYAQVTGNTWAWESQGTFGGQPFKSRYTMTLLSADEYNWKWEMGGSSGPMSVMAEGTEKRVK